MKKTEIDTTKVLVQNVKITTLILDGGLNHLSVRQKVIHFLKQNNIDILALQETRINADSMESHEVFTFYFSTSEICADQIEAEKPRQEQNNL